MLEAFHVEATLVLEATNIWQLNSTASLGLLSVYITGPLILDTHHSPSTHSYLNYKNISTDLQVFSTTPQAHTVCQRG